MHTLAPVLKDNSEHLSSFMFTFTLAGTLSNFFSYCIIREATGKTSSILWNPQFSNKLCALVSDENSTNKKHYKNNNTHDTIKTVIFKLNINQTFFKNIVLKTKQWKLP